MSEPLGGRDALGNGDLRADGRVLRETKSSNLRVHRHTVSIGEGNRFEMGRGNAHNSEICGGVQPGNSPINPPAIVEADDYPWIMAHHMAIGHDGPVLVDGESRPAAGTGLYAYDRGSYRGDQVGQDWGRSREIWPDGAAEEVGCDGGSIGGPAVAGLDSMVGTTGWGFSSVGGPASFSGGGSAGLGSTRSALGVSAPAGRKSVDQIRRPSDHGKDWHQTSKAMLNTASNAPTAKCHHDLSNGKVFRMNRTTVHQTSVAQTADHMKPFHTVAFHDNLLSVSVRRYECGSVKIRQSRASFSTRAPAPHPGIRRLRWAIVLLRTGELRTDSGDSRQRRRLRG